MKGAVAAPFSGSLASRTTVSERLLTILETVSEFNVTTGLLYAAIAHGELAAIRFRARRRIRLKEVDVRAWIERHTTATSDQTRWPLDMRTQPSEVPSLERLLPSEEARRFS
jgi:excisionase family DNA binding protein